LLLDNRVAESVRSVDADDAVWFLHRLMESAPPIATADIDGLEPATISRLVAEFSSALQRTVAQRHAGECAWSSAPAQREFALINIVTITNGDIIPDTPQPRRLNRVLRVFADRADRFARVTFSKCNEGRKRLILNRGFEVAGRQYEFLAYTRTRRSAPPPGSSRRLVAPTMPPPTRQRADCRHRRSVQRRLDSQLDGRFQQDRRAAQVRLAHRHVVQRLVSDVPRAARRDRRDSRHHHRAPEHQLLLHRGLRPDLAVAGAPRVAPGARARRAARHGAARRAGAVGVSGAAAGLQGRACRQSAARRRRRRAPTTTTTTRGRAAARAPAQVDGQVLCAAPEPARGAVSGRRPSAAC
jgi:hypothetical protein